MRGLILNNLNFNRNLVLQYKSNSQAIRVLTESWLSDNMYCPCCGNVVFKKFEIINLLQISIAKNVKDNSN